ncbi:hypothetical protein FACS189454_10370 [Planctomycetales bacterium]|nr:hypothetical protein FACS189454_10370 [Planctomycetales bacterium]
MTNSRWLLNMLTTALENVVDFVEFTLHQWPIVSTQISTQFAIVSENGDYVNFKQIR